MLLPGALRLSSEPGVPRWQKRGAARGWYKFPAVGKQFREQPAAHTWPGRGTGSRQTGRAGAGGRRGGRRARGRARPRGAATACAPPARTGPSGLRPARWRTSKYGGASLDEPRARGGPGNFHRDQALIPAQKRWEVWVGWGRMGGPFICEFGCASHLLIPLTLLGVGEQALALLQPIWTPGEPQGTTPSKLGSHLPDSFPSPFPQQLLPVLSFTPSFLPSQLGPQQDSGGGGWGNG